MRSLTQISLNGGSYKNTIEKSTGDSYNEVVSDPAGSDGAAGGVVRIPPVKLGDPTRPENNTTKKVVDVEKKNGGSGGGSTKKEAGQKPSKNDFQIAGYNGYLVIFLVMVFVATLAKFQSN